MKVACPACSFEHDQSSLDSAGASCKRCGQRLVQSGLEQAQAGRPRAFSIPSRAREELRAATKDIFGGTEQPARPVLISAESIELEKEKEPAPRSSENSVMFSLESLMRGRIDSKAPEPDMVSEQQLLDINGAAPLFGTEHDQALLTTPLSQPSAAAHAMTMPSRRPAGRGGAWRWALGAAALCCVAAAGWWGLDARSASAEASETAAVAPTAPAALPPVSPEAPAAVAAPEAAAAGGPAAGEAVASAEAPVAGEADRAGDASGDEAAAEAPSADAPVVAATAPKAAADEVAPPPKAKRRATKRSRTTKAPRSAAPRARALAKTSGEFDKQAAISALNAASKKASACERQSVFAGAGKVQVTFGPNGRVTNAQIASGAFADATSQCVLRAFRSARVPPFTGDSVTVAKSIRLK